MNLAKAKFNVKIRYEHSFVHGTPFAEGIPMGEEMRNQNIRNLWESFSF